jgi:S-formylglutathione hydrolase FrmB
MNQPGATVSLMQGWLPLAVYGVAVVALVAAVGWRSRRWRLVWVPLVVVVAVAATAFARWYFSTLGSASEPAPWQLWLWVFLTVVGLGALVAGWRGAGWSRRNLAVFAASMCLLSTGLTVNGWIGYVPTVYAAWNQVTGGPLPGQTDQATVTRLQRTSTTPDTGVLVPVRTGSAASGFAVRDEWVYLPPAWFATAPPPQLPAVMMIGGAFNTPADWVRAGGAVSTLDDYAAEHDGTAPVVVFADSGGSFGNDTECVNGTRGNAADHLTKDVVPYVASTFGVRPADWGVAGFSAGGTCAVTLAVKYPQVFGAFVDIAGDLGPNAGTKAQTIDRLYGGDADAWADFDPVTVMQRHGRYSQTSGVFVVPESGHEPDGYAEAARTLCGIGVTHGIDCNTTSLPGRHTWPFGAEAFRQALPWLADRLAGGAAPADRSASLPS